MKLLYLLNQRFPTEKAYGIQVTNMVRAFERAGVDVELLVPTRKNPPQADPIKVRRVYAPDFYFPGSLDRLAFWMKNVISALILSVVVLRSDTDIIYSRDELPLYFLSFFKKNLVFEAHTFSKKRTFLYSRLTKIVAISHGLGEAFAPFGTVLVAHDGVDLEEFAGGPITHDGFVALYAGSDYPWKGVDVFRKASTMIPQVACRIVSGLPHSEIPALLRSADVLVLPHLDTPQSQSPLKLFEYMASGVPIVASDLPSLREILNETNAILVIPNDALALAEGIQNVLSDPRLADIISQNAFEDVQKYSWQKRAVNIVTFIQLQ